METETRTRVNENGRVVIPASYRKALGIDSTSSFAALRLGQIYAQQGNRSEAVKLLRQASADRTKNPAIAAQADKFLRDMGS